MGYIKKKILSEVYILLYRAEAWCYRCIVHIICSLRPEECGFIMKNSTTNS